MSWIQENWLPLTVVGGLIGVSWYAGKKFEEQESFNADEEDMVYCNHCSDIIGNEKEVYDDETVDYEMANGEVVCVPCYKIWMKEYENDLDPQYTPFYAESFNAEDEKRKELNKYRIGHMKVREYDDGSIERYEADEAIWNNASKEQRLKWLKDAIPSIGDKYADYTWRELTPRLQKEMADESYDPEVDEGDFYMSFGRKRPYSVKKGMEWGVPNTRKNNALNWEILDSLEVGDEIDLIVKRFGRGHPSFGREEGMRTTTVKEILDGLPSSHRKEVAYMLNPYYRETWKTVETLSKHLKKIIIFDNGETILLLDRPPSPNPDSTYCHFYFKKSGLRFGGQHDWDNENKYRRGLIVGEIKKSNNRAETFAAYVSKADTQRVRQLLKQEFPNLKFSVVKDGGRMSVSIMAGDIDFSDINDDVPRLKRYWERWGNPKPVFDGRLDINQYHLDGYNPKYTPLFEKIVSIMKGEDWYDDSDPQTDYFNTAYYIDLNIGKWNKPYEYKPTIKRGTRPTLEGLVYKQGYGDDALTGLKGAYDAETFEAVAVSKKEVKTPVEKVIQHERMMNELARNDLLTKLTYDLSLRRGGVRKATRRFKNAEYDSRLKKEFGDD